MFRKKCSRILEILKLTMFGHVDGVHCAVLDHHQCLLHRTISNL